MLNKYRILLSLCVAFVLAPSMVFGQISDAQIWDVQLPDDYAGGARGSEGFFLSAEGLYWSLPNPGREVVGNPDVNQKAYSYAQGSTTQIREEIQKNSWTTDLIPNKWEVGQRYTLGFMNQHRGWEFSGFTLNGSSYYEGHNVQVAIDDKNNVDYHGLLSGTFLGASAEDWFDPTQCRPTAEGLEVKRMLVQFDSANMSNKMDVWGLELNGLYRFHPTRIGIFEGIFGVRHLRWDEDFFMQTGSSYFLSGSTWASDVENKIIGPQLGLRWSCQVARFSMEGMGKFTAGYNAQVAETRCALGANTGTSYQSQIDNGKTATDREKMDEFSPFFEFGFKLNYNLTRCIKLNCGWSGIYAMNIARSTDVIDYSINNSEGLLQVDRHNNRSDAFTHGFTFGVTLNR